MKELLKQVGLVKARNKKMKTLSGGMKRRAGIAQSMLNDPKILILDDSVSAVDTKTERTILNNLHATRAGKTTILIAHRISTIEKMDKILFIDDCKLSIDVPQCSITADHSWYSVDVIFIF